MTACEKPPLFWSFLFLTLIFRDVFSRMDPALIQALASTGQIGGIVMTREPLPGFAVVRELGKVMVRGARMRPHGPSRAASLRIGLGLIVGQAGSLMTGENTPHYRVFSAVEIATLASIVRAAARSRRPSPQPRCSLTGSVRASRTIWAM